MKHSQQRISKESSLETEFHDEILSAIAEAKKLKHYSPRIANRVHRLGGAEAAREQLAKREIPLGLMKLQELGLLRFSLEKYVIEDRYSALFSGDIAQPTLNPLFL